jgi:hypothetical protein
VRHHRPLRLRRLGNDAFGNARGASPRRGSRWKTRCANACRDARRLFGRPSAAISVFLSLLWSGTSCPTEPYSLTPCWRSSPLLPLVWVPPRGLSSIPGLWSSGLFATRRDKAFG